MTILSRAGVYHCAARYVNIDYDYFEQGFTTVPHVTSLLR